MDQLNSGAFEVLVNAEELGVFSGVSGQISATTPNGLDQFIVDEEVSLNGRSRTRCRRTRTTKTSSLPNWQPEPVGRSQFNA